MLRTVSIFLILLLGASPTFAELWLPAIFGNQMVLQQDTHVKIWGTAKQGQPVEIRASWEKQHYTVIPGADGSWNIPLRTLPADNRSYEIIVSQGKDSQTFSDILFGEVWLCSGQSNMEMKMKGYYSKPILEGPEAIANGANPLLRFFEVEKAFSHLKQPDCKGQWQTADPATVANFSAAAYFFGRQLQQTLGVPVALIAAPWGGAAIESFMSREALQAFPQCIIPTSKEAIKSPNRTPTALFNAMLYPLIGYGIKGCIWYQGETNRKEPTLYKQLYKAMLTDWRTRWGIGDFPVYYAQIAPFTYGDESNSAFMREAQAQCQQEIDNTYMVTLLDVGEERDIHPSDKQTVGFRFATVALDKTYQRKGIVSDGPVYQSMIVEKGKVSLSFGLADNGLTTYNQPLNQFQIAGADRVFYPAKALIVRKNVIVFCDEVPEPVAVRYGFTDYVKGTLYNIEGCPASSFRTDNWDK